MALLCGNLTKLLKYDILVSAFIVQANGRVYCERKCPMKKGNVLAGEKQLDELRICVEKAFNKLRGRIDVDTAQGWIGNSEALDRWAEQLLPLEIALAESPLFEHMPDLDHKAFPGSLAFRFDDFFTTDRAIFSFVGPNAKEWFGGMEIPAASPSKLTLDWLTRAEYDPKIVETLGEENCDLSLGVLRWLFENDVFEKGRWYACYAPDKNVLP